MTYVVSCVELFSRPEIKTLWLAAVAGGRYSVFPTGELHIREARAEDGAEPYRCETRHRLTGATRLSAVAGR